VELSKNILQHFPEVPSIIQSNEGFKKTLSESVFQNYHDIYDINYINYLNEVLNFLLVPILSSPKIQKSIIDVRLTTLHSSS